MIHEISINEFNYELREGMIARFPLPERDQSRLLICQDGILSESLFSEVDRQLPEGSLLVFNNTRVIHARLLFERSTGAKIEIFCLEPWVPKEYQLSFQSLFSVEWKCLVGNARKWKNEMLEKALTINGQKILLLAEIMEREGETFIIRFSWNLPLTFAEVVEAAGKVPIPPYLHREDEEIDKARYQTVYARSDGSVAAPTAGLHFTEAVFSNLRNKGIEMAELTLHVGAGTFLPVKSDSVKDHRMHTETVIIDKELLQKLIRNTGKIVAVGTTSVRSLESLYWLGLKISLADLRISREPGGSLQFLDYSNDPRSSGETEPDGKYLATDPSSHELLHVSQWEPYQNPGGPPVKEVLKHLYEWMEFREMERFTFTTSLMILPGYRFQMTDGMITNFHQPRSTLLLLVAAFLGDDWKKAYEYALLNNFRFLSYGDSNLYLKSSSE